MRHFPIYLLLPCIQLFLKCVFYLNMFISFLSVLLFLQCNLLYFYFLRNLLFFQCLTSFLSILLALLLFLMLLSFLSYSHFFSFLCILLTSFYVTYLYFYLHYFSFYVTYLSFNVYFFLFACASFFVFCPILSKSNDDDPPTYLPTHLYLHVSLLVLPYFNLTVCLSLLHVS